MLRAVGAHPRNIDEGHVWIEARQHPRRREGETISDALVLFLGYADRGHAQTEEARVEAGELVFDGREVKEIVVQKFAELGVLLAGGAASDGDHAFDIGIEQALAQNALTDHPGCAKEKKLHLFIIRPVRYSFHCTHRKKGQASGVAPGLDSYGRKMTTC